MGTEAEPFRRWREALDAWAIPEPVLAAAPESPWVLPVGVFRRRADASAAAPAGPSFERAREALGKGGSVLDVGAGAGAASLPLLPWTTRLTAVDSSEEMLEELRAAAGRSKKEIRVVAGRWPDVAPTVEAADVVVCHHVVYNAPDLDAFALALDDHARARVVVELTARHPLSALNPLWQRFHGLTRPEEPTAEDAARALRTLGFDVRTERSKRAVEVAYDSFDDLVAVTRRRLCLTADRDPEVAEALVEHGADPERPSDLGSSGRELVTLWWDRRR